MKRFKKSLLLLIVTLINVQLIQLNHVGSCLQLNLSRDMMLGAATSAYQIEGGWNADGKGKSSLDFWFHDIPNVTRDGSNGDETAMSYYKYAEDVESLKLLGVDHYRFSISWSRIMPTGLPDAINQIGVDYYMNLIKLLRANNIEPHVTMNHFDLPLDLYLKGGLLSSDIVNWFGNYAKFLYKTYGTHVKWWTTFNQPISSCGYGYLTTSGNGYRCILNVLKAHATAYHIYDDEFRKEQDGKVSLVIKCDWFTEINRDKENVMAAERKRQFTIGILAHPIYARSGNFPSMIKRWVEKNSRIAGLNISLPTMSEEDVNYIRGTADYFALNHYTTYYTRSSTTNLIATYKDCRIDDVGSFSTVNTSKKGSTALSWNKIEPDGLKNVLIWLKKTYGNQTFFITENGYADENLSNDVDRIAYHKQYLASLIDAIDNHDVKVSGYTVWSLIDNLEFLEGYKPTFGLFKIDMQNENRSRVPKKSVEIFQEIIRTRVIII